MSPVSSAVSVPGVNRQTWVSNVPQFNTSACCSRWPARRVSPSSTVEEGVSRITGHRPGVLSQFGRKVRQGLRVDVGFEDSPYLPMVALTAQLAQEAEFGGLLDRRLRLVHDSCVVGGLGLEEPQHLYDLIGGENQSALTAGRLELDEPLAQYHQEQADVVRQCPPAHQARERLITVFLWLGAKIGVALGVIDHHVDADGGEMISHAGAQTFQCQPGVLVRIAVDDPLHQPDDGAGECMLVAHRRRTVTFGSLARLVKSGSAGSEYSRTASSASSMSTVTFSSLSPR